MAFLYTDIAESGVRVWCGEDGIVHFGTFGHKAPSPLLYLRAVNVGETVIAIGQLHIGGQTYICNSHGARRVLGANHGVAAHGLCALDANSVRAVWVASASTAWSAQLDRVTLIDVGQQEPFPNPNGSSQGLLDVFPDSVIWTDFARVQTIDGLQYGLPMTRADWTVGQDYQGVNGFAVLAHHWPTRKHYVAWRGGTQIAPKVNYAGTVAVSSFGTPETLFRTPDQFQPALLKPEDPDEPDEPDPDEPEEPEDPSMADRVYIQDQSSKPNLMMGRPLKEIAHGELIELRLDDGKMLSVLPDGRFTFDATSFQAYQHFRIAKNNPSQYICERDGKVYYYGRLVVE